MRSLYITLSFIFLLSIFVFFNIPSKIRAEKGVVRLEKNFSESHSYSLLTGEWEVYSDRLITPQEFSAGGFSSTMFRNFSKPSFFSSDLDGAMVTTLRMTVHTKDSNSPIALYFPNMGCGFTVWADGKALNNSANGCMKSCGQSCIYQNVNFIPSSDSFDIVVHMENTGFSQKSALKNIRLGSPDSINRYRMSFLAGEMFMIGCFLITGLYGLFLFFKNKSEKKMLILSLLCFIEPLRNLLSDSSFFHYILGILPWNLQTRLSIPVMTVIAFMVFLFVSELFDFSKGRAAIKVYGAYGAGVSMAGFFLAPAYWSTVYFFYLLFIFFISAYVCFITGYALLKKVRIPFSFVVAGIGFLYFQLLGSLISGQYLGYDDFTCLGIFVFAFTQILWLSLKSESSYINEVFFESSIINEELKSLNAMLELQLSQKSFEIQQLQKKIHQHHKKLS